MYFEGDPLIQKCPIVSTISCPEAINRLIGRYDHSNNVPFDLRAYRFDITLRGQAVTPFETQSNHP